MNWLFDLAPPRPPSPVLTARIVVNGRGGYGIQTADAGAAEEPVGNYASPADARRTAERSGFTILDPEPAAEATLLTHTPVPWETVT